MSKEQILIIDTDPGVDDALALTMLSNLNNNVDNYSKIIMSSIGGNTSLKNTHQNMLNIIGVTKLKHSEILKGSESTLTGEKFVDAEHYHGKNGLTLQLDQNTDSHSKLETYEYLHELLLKNDNVEVTLLMLGPLTNLAKSLVSIPETKKIIKSVVIMGGAFYVPGNATKYAEFNIYADPEAANIVFKSGLHIKAIGLDVCDNVIINKERFYNSQYEFNKSKSVLGKFSNSIIDSFFDYHKDKTEMSLCDPIAVICLFYENLFSYKSKEVNVDTGKLKKGLTMPTKNKGKIDIAVDLDIKKVMDLIDKNLI
jgi:inosine-uridine nucleoside N-ribohydrolase|tara:strand:- start:458 stop:1390 length:933 start_codon:yes stop_codon:yes gene_type:complete